MKCIIVLIMGLCCAIGLSGQASLRMQQLTFDAVFVQDCEGVYQVRSTWAPADPSDSLSYKDNVRWVAIGLNLTLGMLGVHRLYLGTDVKVPVVYALTFGGGGVLWLVDLALLIANKDIRPFMNNKHLFMFSRK